MNNFHTPVLTNTVSEFLNLKQGGCYIDCTLGTGGHSLAILEELQGNANIYGIDADERNLAIARERLARYPKIHFIHDNFENLESIGRDILTREARIDGILFDLGLSSPHVDDVSRGFSFQHEAPLDMRFDTRQKRMAADIVNNASLEQLLYIFQTYGNEKFSYRIATAILKSRRGRKFTTTSQLADLVRACVPKTPASFKRHPATRIFQALRIATNREIEVLEAGLEAASKLLSKGGRVVVIAYHSLEDRIVKIFFKKCHAEGVLTILTKRPHTPTPEEISLNRRSRSACLRAAEKN